MKIGDRVKTFDPINPKEETTGRIVDYHDIFYFVKMDNLPKAEAIARLEVDLVKLETPLEKLVKRLNDE